PRRQDGAPYDRLGHRAVVIEPVLERRTHHRIDRGGHFGVVQTVLRLPLELRLLDEEAQNTREPLANVLGRQRDALWRQVVRVDVVADRLAETDAEAVLVGAAGTGGDAVYEAAQVLVGGLGPLQRQLQPRI